MSGYLEETKQQYECLHHSFEKVIDMGEVYWRCMDCGATSVTSALPETKMQATPIPEWKQRQFDMKEATNARQDTRDV